MVEPISYRDMFPEKSLFDEKKFKITLHTSSFIDLDEEELFALDLLKSFKVVDIIETGKSDYPWISLTYNDGFINGSVGDRSFAVGRDSNEIYAKKLIWDDDFHHAPTDYRELKCDLDLLDAHSSLGQYVFVTTKKYIIANKAFFARYNARTPIETLKLLRLYLCQNPVIKFKPSPKVNLSVSLTSFYTELALLRIPNLREFSFHCYTSKQNRNDELVKLCQSIIIRFRRVYQARDKIGIAFHNVLKESHYSEEILYHFDYFMLLLAGVIDSFLRIVHRIYELDTPRSERQIKFSDKKFLNALKENGANDLSCFLSSEEVNVIYRLLYNFRNTIHGVNLKATKAYEDFRGEILFIQFVNYVDQSVLEESGLHHGDIFLEDYGELYKELESALEKNIIGLDWGVEKEYFNGMIKKDQIWKFQKIKMEPNKFANMILEKVIKISSEIIRLIDVQKLYKNEQILEYKFSENKLDKELAKMINLMG